MIDRAHGLPITRQAALVGVSRGTAYYRPEPDNQESLALMRRIDELHLEHPFAGSRMLRDLLRQQLIQRLIHPAEVTDVAPVDGVRVVTEMVVGQLPQGLDLVEDHR